MSPTYRQKNKKRERNTIYSGIFKYKHKNARLGVCKGKKVVQKYQKSL